MTEALALLYMLVNAFACGFLACLMFGREVLAPWRGGEVRMLRMQRRSRHPPDGCGLVFTPFSGHPCSREHSSRRRKRFGEAAVGSPPS